MTNRYLRSLPAGGAVSGAETAASHIIIDSARNPTHSVGFRARSPIMALTGCGDLCFDTTIGGSAPLLS
jgi:hypothetical protein